MLDQSDPAFADKVKHVRDAKSRMSVVWNHCKSKNHCEPDVIEENEGEVPDEVVPVKKGHGGCGHVQPQIRKEGLKLFLQYKKTKDEDDMVCVSPEDIACLPLQIPDCSSLHRTSNRHNLRSVFLLPQSVSTYLKRYLLRTFRYLG